MRSDDDAAPEHGSHLRLLDAFGAWLGGVLAAALLLGMFDGGVPRPTRAEAAAPVRPLVQMAASGLCFHGPGGELLDFAPAGQGCR